MSTHNTRRHQQAKKNAPESSVVHSRPAASAKWRTVLRWLMQPRLVTTALGFVMSGTILAGTMGGLGGAVAQAATLIEDSSTNAQAPSIALTGIRHEWQTWNNCGPAVLAMNLSYYGESLTQGNIAATLRPNPKDQNVRAEELVDYARDLGYNAFLRVNGDADRLKKLLNHEIPVLVETWAGAVIEDGYAHFRLVTGYEDANERWIVYDPYFPNRLVNPSGVYAGSYLSYTEMARLWAITNSKYVLIFPHEKIAAVTEVLRTDLADAVMWQDSLQESRAAVEQQPTSPFAWFNLGTNLAATGHYADAAAAFDEARTLGLPWRMIWYQYGPFRAYLAVGRYQETVALAQQAIRQSVGIEELYLWKGLALARLGQPHEAAQSLTQALTLNPNYAAAKDALGELAY